MKRTLIFFAVIALAACDPDMTMQQRQIMSAQDVPVSEHGRVAVERIGVFKDDLAYGVRRGIYVIHDTETGREFIGVSGIGIAERGSHQSNKMSVADER